MNVKEIETLPLNDQFRLLKKNCNKITFGQIKQNIEFYEGRHKILIDPDRQDYLIKEMVENIDGVKEEKLYTVHQSKLALPYADQIVSCGVGFLYGSDIDLIMEGDREDKDAQEAFAKLKDILWKDVRIMSVLKAATRASFIETRSAIQFFLDEDKIKAKVLCMKDGYKIWRHKNDAGKVDAAVVEYKRDKIVSGVLLCDVSTTEIWTAEGMRRFEGQVQIDKDDLPIKINKSNRLKKINTVDAPINKLLFDYLEQDECEFGKVVGLIEKQDYARSQHSDVNVRIGNPALVVNGKIASKPLYNDTVKIYEITSDNTFDPSKSSTADMKYLELSSAPESVKLEMSLNENDIYRFTWPDLNKLMTEMKNGNLSTQSMKLTFLQAFVKLAEKQEIHDEFVARAINIVKDMATALYPEVKGMKDLKVSFNYNSILPDSTAEMVNMLAVAVGAGITSIDNAVRILSINTPETTGELKKESAAEAQLKAKVAADASAKAQADANTKVVADAVKNGVENPRNAAGNNGGLPPKGTTKQK